MNQDYGLVSIIIPVYNVENYIANCVKSVMAQSYNNIEIVLVDDCSSDNSSFICDGLSKEYKNVIFFRHDKNCGQTVTRNDGIRLCTGKWMMFLDADDRLSQEAVEKLVTRINMDQSDIVFSAYETFDDKNNRKTFSARIPNGVYNVENFIAHLYNNIPMNVLSCIGSKIYNTHFVKHVKKSTTNDVKTNYDMAFIIDALLAAKKVSYINDSLYEYYQRASSITHTYRKDMYNRINFARRRMKELLTRFNCFEEKKTYYYQMQYITIMWSLKQEIIFSTGEEKFKNVFFQIRNDEKGMEVADEILSYDNAFKHKLSMWLLKHNHWRSMYIMLKCR